MALKKTFVFNFDDFDESKCKLKIDPRKRIRRCANTDQSDESATTKGTSDNSSSSNNSSNSNSNKNDMWKKVRAKDWEPDDSNFRRVVRVTDIPRKFQNYQSLYEIFIKFGEIEKISIDSARDKRDIGLGRSKILFNNMESSQICAAIMNETELLDRTLQVFIGQPPSIREKLQKEREKNRQQRYYLRKQQRLQQKFMKKRIRNMHYMQQIGSVGHIPHIGHIPPMGPIPPMASMASMASMGGMGGMGIPPHMQPRPPPPPAHYDPYYEAPYDPYSDNIYGDTSSSYNNTNNSYSNQWGYGPRRGSNRYRRQ